MDFADRVVLVTGASSGIGRQLALDFAARRARLALVARRADRLEAVAGECRALGAEAESLLGDLLVPDLPEDLVERVVERFGRLDVLLNNAGVPKRKLVFDLDADDVERTLRVNFLAAARLCLAALPPMLRQGEGFIVNISSGAGRLAPPRESVYAASKFALSGFSEGLALDLAGSGIHTAVVHVGPVDTEIWSKAAADSPVRFRGRLHPPSLVSKAVLRCIEERRHEATVPGWLRPIFALKALVPGVFRRGAARYDPVPRESIAEARRRARGEPVRLP